MIANTNTCQFEHPYRWHEFADQIHKGPEGMATFMELANMNHRAVEDHLNNRPCGGGVDSGQMIGGTATSINITPKTVTAYTSSTATSGFGAYFTKNTTTGLFTCVKACSVYANVWGTWNNPGDVSQNNALFRMAIYSSNFADVVFDIQQWVNLYYLTGDGAGPGPTQTGTIISCAVGDTLKVSCVYADPTGAGTTFVAGIGAVRFDIIVIGAMT